MALVIKEWAVAWGEGGRSSTVLIRGREEGLASFVLSAIGVDPTTTVRVTRTEIVFEAGSWNGFVRRVIPLQNVCSMYYGYIKPWQVAILIGSGLALLMSPHGVAVALVGGLIAAQVYCWLNVELNLGVIENSGVTNGIAFKRSVIEGVSIDESEAQRVVELISKLIRDVGEAAHSPPQLPTPPATEMAICGGCGESLAAGGSFCEMCGKPVWA